MRSFEKYCKCYEDIENYEKAKADNFKGWHCHHRLETHTPDGKRREVDIHMEELKALGMYYNRPAEELIFLTTREHNVIRKVSEETRKKLSMAGKGHPVSEETRNKIGAAKKGKPKSDETRKKMSESKKGMRWFNNGKICIRAKECPPGFVPGRLRK